MGKFCTLNAYDLVRLAIDPINIHAASPRLAFLMASTKEFREFDSAILANRQAFMAIPLVALGLPHLAAYLNPGKPALQKRRDGLTRLAIVAVPLQTYAGWNGSFDLLQDTITTEPAASATSRLACRPSPSPWAPSARAVTGLCWWKGTPGSASEVLGGLLPPR